MSSGVQSLVVAGTKTVAQYVSAPLAKGGVRTLGGVTREIEYKKSEDDDESSTSGKGNGSSGVVNLKPMSGFADYSEGQNYEFSRWLSITARAFKTYGFTRFHPRPFEHKENLMKGGIGHQVYGVYRLSDAEQSSDSDISKTVTGYGIPFDRTVPFAVWAAQRLSETALPVKRFDISHSFRGEHAQKGRFRAFIQADVDIIDRQLNTIADYECLMAMIRTLQSLKIGEFVISLNHMTIAKAIIKDFKIPADLEPGVLRNIDKLDKLSKEDVCKAIEKILPDFDPAAIKNLVEKFSFRGDPEEFEKLIAKETASQKEVQIAFRDLMEIYSYLRTAKVPKEMLKLCPGMVRGLNYYTGMVFETHIIGKEEIGSVASGGRYSNLVGEFNPKYSDVGGVGASIGLTRLFDILVVVPKVATPRKTTADFLIGYRTGALKANAVEVAEALRAQGQKVDLFTRPDTKVAKQFEYAHKKGIPQVVMVMENNAYVIKDMKSGNQEEVDTVQRVVSRILPSVAQPTYVYFV